MKLAETVTFGGSGLDRAAHLRGTDQCFPKDGDLVVVFGRGNIALDVKRNHDVALFTWPLCIVDDLEIIFLGKSDGNTYYGVDISSCNFPNQFSNVDSIFHGNGYIHPQFGEDFPFCDLRGAMAQLTPRNAELAAMAKALFHWHHTHQFCSKCGAQTYMEMSGWQRGCNACDLKHFPRTDPVVIMLITSENSVLMGRSHGWSEGMYSLLAGFVESGETIEAAVRRETQEEAGIKVGDVRYLASQPWAFPYSLMIGCHGVALNNHIDLDETELEDARWFSKAELVQVLSGESQHIRPARAGSIAHFLVKSWLADKLE